MGEGVIYDLRVALYTHLQHMSLRFFTNTKLGELMSRLNNDVIGAQNAISNTIVNIVTNLIQTTAVLVVMLSLNWQLTLIGVAILPIFLLVARNMALRLREIARRHMDANAQMNAMLNETLNISGTLLVKLFGREDTEVRRLQERAKSVRDIGVQRAVSGSLFCKSGAPYISHPCAVAEILLREFGIQGFGPSVGCSFARHRRVHSPGHPR